MSSNVRVQRIDLIRTTLARASSVGPSAFAGAEMTSNLDRMHHNQPYQTATSGAAWPGRAGNDVWTATITDTDTDMHPAWHRGSATRSDGPPRSLPSSD